MNFKKTILFFKKLILRYKFLYEIYFLITGKKINRKKIEQKIDQFNKHHTKKEQIQGLIVSLTTYGERLKDVQYTLYSIFEQSLLPEKVILWVSYNDYKQNEEYISVLLKLFNVPCFEIRETKDIFSYGKLIPALENFPDYYILTADDDIYYKKDWIKKVWIEHQKNPDDIICHVAHEILMNGSIILPYGQWKHNVVNKKANILTFGCGCGGGLYHKKYLYRDITDEKIFLKLAPTADDIWFYFMVIMNNRKYKIVKRPYNHLKCTDVYKEYGLNDKKTLASLNVNQGKNDVQFSAVMKYYNFDFSSLQ